MRAAIIFGSLSFFILMIGHSMLYIVNPGETAIKTRLGKIIFSTMNTGAYSKYPLMDSIIYIDNRVRKTSIETAALTKDLQFVSIGIAVNYRIIDAVKLYCNVGLKFEKTIIDPFSQETIKAIVAQFTAENLIQYRHEAKEKVLAELKKRLAELYIETIDFNFVHLDFSAEFIKSVEEKQIAMQRAITAKNLTEKIKEEALQARCTADAEAYSLKIKKDATSPELVDLKKIESVLEAIKRWDGKLPQYVGSVPTLFKEVA